MNKIKEIIKKIKGFKIFDYILGRKIISLTKEYDINGELITIHTNSIDNWTRMITIAKNMIASLLEENEMIKDKVKDINRIK